MCQDYGSDSQTAQQVETWKPLLAYAQDRQRARSIISVGREKRVSASAAAVVAMSTLRNYESSCLEDTTCCDKDAVSVCGLGR